MDTQKKEILCQLHEIGMLICKLNDNKKLKHCDRKVKDLHLFLKRTKSKSKSKTMRKKPKRSYTDTLLSDKPLLEDVDRISIPKVDIQESMEPDTQESEYSTEPTSSSSSFTEKPTALYTSNLQSLNLRDDDPYTNRFG